MESLCKTNSIKVELPLLCSKVLREISDIAQRYKVNFICTLFVFILIGLPIYIEYFLKTSYTTTFCIIFILYPFYYMVYRIGRRSMNCKYMP